MVVARISLCEKLKRPLLFPFLSDRLHTITDRVSYYLHRIYQDLNKVKVSKTLDFVFLLLFLNTFTLYIYIYIYIFQSTPQLLTSQPSTTLPTNLQNGHRLPPSHRHIPPLRIFHPPAHHHHFRSRHQRYRNLESQIDKWNRFPQFRRFVWHFWILCFGC